MPISYYFVGLMQVLRFLISKVVDYGNFELYPCICDKCWLKPDCTFDALRQQGTQVDVFLNVSYNMIAVTK